MEADCLAYLSKATESLTSAESEFANGRYNSCANRCYYAMFQAAVAALIAAGVRPVNVKEQWGHDFVQAQFAGLLIRRRKLYPSALSPLLFDTLKTRQTADYDTDMVSRKAVERALRDAKLFVATVKGRLL